MSLRIERDRRQRPHVAPGHHVGGRGGEFLEMIGGAMGVERGLVVIDLEKEHVVRVLGENRDVELAASRLLHRGSAVLLDELEEFRGIGRIDVEVDRVDVDATGLGSRFAPAIAAARRRRAAARWPQRTDKPISSCEFLHWLSCGCLPNCS
jgi:hypothetical protein